MVVKKVRSKIKSLTNKKVTYKKIFESIEDLYPLSQVQNDHTIKYIIQDNYLQVYVKSIIVKVIICDDNYHDDVTFSIHITSNRVRRKIYNYSYNLQSFPVKESEIKSNVQEILIESIQKYMESCSPFYNIGDNMSDYLINSTHKVKCICGERFFMDDEELSFPLYTRDKFTMLKLYKIAKVCEHLEDCEYGTGHNFRGLFNTV